MQFSKKVTQLATLYNIDPKDVLFAFLLSAGASAPESFAVIFRPASTSNTSLASKASNYIGQRPGLKSLINELAKDPDSNMNKRGRPRTKEVKPIEDDTPLLDYTDKDAVLKWLANLATRAEKESTQLAAINAISTLQRMKQETAIEDEKRVIFYIPLTYSRCEELTEYLRRYYSDQKNDYTALV